MFNCYRCNIQKNVNISLITRKRNLSLKFIRKKLNKSEILGLTSSNPEIWGKIGPGLEPLITMLSEKDRTDISALKLLNDINLYYSFEH